MGLAAVEEGSFEILPKVLYRHRIHRSQTTHTVRDRFLRIINERRSQVLHRDRPFSDSIRNELAGIARLLQATVRERDSAGAFVLGRDSEGLFSIPAANSWLEVVLHERRPEWLLLCSNRWLDLGALPLELLRGETVLGLVADTRVPTTIDMAFWYSGYLDVIVATSTPTSALIAPYLASSTSLIGVNQ